MSNGLILSLLLSYFLVLILISYLTGRKADNETFFTGNKNNKWYIVAFGMIGASLSGVTFISIPGVIEGSQMTYLQMAVGYIIGYFLIAFVLLPLYYRLNLTSIYSYLDQRYGSTTYRIGAGFFILSRIIGASLRLYLVANVLQTFVMDDLGSPFWLTVTLSILLIWVYTHRGGIKTIIWTDTLQTMFMLVSVGISVYLISDDLNIALSNIYHEISGFGYGEVWQTDNPLAANYWWKGVLGGMFITLGMTGVDQDMMQKNLTCENQKEAKKNMISFSIVLFFVNVLFVVLGGLLFLYVDNHPEVCAAWGEHGFDKDLLFATISLESGLGVGIGIFFLLGLIAAAYSSADSALTSLTTSISVDFFDVEKKEKEEQERIRKRSHIIMSVVLLATILIFKSIVSESVIWELFKAAGFTYGPLLGLFMFGIISKRRVKDLSASLICILVATGIFLFSKFILPMEFMGGYQFGSELLGLNALMVFMFLWIFSVKADKISEIR
ncbi:sodium:solute symporter [Crocinitomix catalasitica]|nr:sodium:solute symporter [Crocinitomix catalasitica]